METIRIKGHVGKWQALQTVQVKDLNGDTFQITEYEHELYKERTPHIWLDEIGQVIVAASRAGVADLITHGYEEVKND